MATLNLNVISCKIKNKKAMKENQRWNSGEASVAEYESSSGELLVTFDGDSKSYSDLIWDFACMFRLYPNRD